MKIDRKKNLIKIIIEIGRRKMREIIEIIVKTIVYLGAISLFIYDLKFRNNKSTKYKNIRDGAMIALLVYFGVTTSLGIIKGITLLFIGMIIGICIFKSMFKIELIKKDENEIK